ncbi:MAG: hypothetical protein HFF20_08935 [Oscillospiraceae bacterium]|jgi:hypothetical protein|nr:hypothetical protein [Oscillospiraceae bacterium]MCI9549329.1 hypothetical protein [Oscillospiraceae bacterium]
MKRYQKFMDGVKPSDTLGQRLRALKEPKKKPAWTKYGAMAAALVLVCGLGWYGLDYWQAVVSRQRFLERAQVYHTEGVPAQPEPDESMEPAAHMFAGSYEVTKGGKTASYLLPYIDYGDTGLSEVQTALDWDIPQGALKGDLSRNHIVRLLGGEDVLSTHLDWDGYELSGWTAWLRDGSFWGAYIQGYQGPLDHFEFAVTAGRLPPTCIVYPQSVEQNICGVTVIADKHDGNGACSRRVSFMKEDHGFRFDLTSTDAEQAEVLVSRLVRWVTEGGKDWTADGMALTVLGKEDVLGEEFITCNVCGQSFPKENVSAHVHTFHGADRDPIYSKENVVCEVCGETYPKMEEKAHAYSVHGVGEPNWNDGAPAVSADHSYVAPAVSAQPGYTCPECGEEIMPGTAHGHGICGLPLAPTPGVNTCPDCGVSYPAGEAHYHTQTCPECGETYQSGHHHACEADPVYTCEVCGQIVPAGMEHSHRQEGHHGGHH